MRKDNFYCCGWVNSAPDSRLRSGCPTRRTLNLSCMCRRRRLYPAKLLSCTLPSVITVCCNFWHPKQNTLTKAGTLPFSVSDGNWRTVSCFSFARLAKASTSMVISLSRLYSSSETFLSKDPRCLFDRFFLYGIKSESLVLWLEYLPSLQSASRSIFWRKLPFRF